MWKSRGWGRLKPVYYQHLGMPTMGSTRLTSYIVLCIVCLFPSMLWLKRPTVCFFTHLSYTNKHLQSIGDTPMTLQKISHEHTFNAFKNSGVSVKTQAVKGQKHEGLVSKYFSGSGGPISFCQTRLFIFFCISNKLSCMSWLNS